MSVTQAFEWAREYLTGASAWAYPAYDAYDTRSDPHSIEDADLLAPVLLNVNRLTLKAYYGLQEQRDRLQDSLAAIPEDAELTSAGDDDLEPIRMLFSVLDNPGIPDVQGTILAKILHRKRPGFIPLYDERVRRCYQVGQRAPLPVRRGRPWGEFFVALAMAMRNDLVDQRDAWAEIAALATNPRISLLRALDIVAWHAGGVVPLCIVDSADAIHATSSRCERVRPARRGSGRVAPVGSRAKNAGEHVRRQISIRARSTMETRVRTPHDVFFAPQRLLVPLFQRPYVWSKEGQWQMLWDDIRRQADRMVATGLPPTPHFLGAVVIQTQPVTIGNLPQWTIIDGQQRLTTLQLAYDAAHQMLTLAGDVIPAKQVEDLVVNPLTSASPSKTGSRSGRPIVTVPRSMR